MSGDGERCRAITPFGLRRLQNRGFATVGGHPYVHKLTDATALQLAVLNFENMSNCDARAVAYSL